MILGMTTSTFTLVHVLISLVGIASGLVVVFGLLTGKRLDGWTALFLATTVATSVTRFAFPFDHLLPSHKVGIISLAVLAGADPAPLFLYLFWGLGRHFRVHSPFPPLLHFFFCGVSVFLES